MYWENEDPLNSFSGSHQLTYIVGGLQISVRSISLDRFHQMEYFI